MRLGLVIPYYKLSYFQECLDSIVDQKNTNFSVYIGDDASPENPISLINRYKNKFQVCYYRFETNLGKTSLVKHWERCISMTSGEEYLLILGDDDILGPNVVSTFYLEQDKFYKRKQLVRFSSAMINENSILTTPVYQHPETEKATDSFFRKFKGFTRSSLSEYAFPREAYEEKGFHDYPLGWHSDDRAWLEFSGQKPIFSINDATVYIRNSGQNISSRKDNVQDKLMATREFHRFMLDNYLHEFDTDRKYGLIYAYEELLKTYGKFGFEDWKFIARLHILHFRLRNFKIFVRRSLSL